MPAGRPSKYTPEMIERSLDYLSEWDTEGDIIPSIEGLALYTGLHRSTIYDWYGEEDKKEFSDIVEKVLVKQSKILQQKGLQGEFNSTITKLLLTKHGFSDKADITSGDKPLATGVIILPEKEEAE